MPNKLLEEIQQAPSVIGAASKQTNILRSGSEAEKRLLGVGPQTKQNPKLTAYDAQRGI